MNEGRRRILMNPPGATDVFSITGLVGRTAMMADAAAMGFDGAPSVPCWCKRQNRARLGISLVADSNSAHSMQRCFGIEGTSRRTREPKTMEGGLPMDVATTRLH